MAKRPGFTNFTFHLKLLHILQTHAPVSLNKFDHARRNFVSFFLKKNAKTYHYYPVSIVLGYMVLAFFQFKFPLKINI